MGSSSEAIINELRVLRGKMEMVLNKGNPKYSKEIIRKVKLPIKSVFNNFSHSNVHPGQIC